MLCFTSKYVTWVIYNDLYNTCFHYAVHLAAHVHDINRQEMQDQQSVVCWHDDFVKMCWHLEKSCECVVNSSAAKKRYSSGHFSRKSTTKNQPFTATFNVFLHTHSAYPTFDHVLSFWHRFSLCGNWNVHTQWIILKNTSIHYIESTKLSPTLPTSDIDSEVFFIFFILFFYFFIWISNHEPNQLNCFNIKQKLI